MVLPKFSSEFSLSGNPRGERSEERILSGVYRMIMIIVVCTLMMALASSSSIESSTGPNIVLLVLDDIGWAGK